MNELKSVILAIESSCDETACAVIRDGHEICANVVSTQIKIHEKFGGVVPEVASRKHLEYIDIVIEEALAESGYSFAELDAIAVTMGPGLIGALLVGLSTAKGLAYALEKPLIGAHHIEGHIYANFLAHPEITLPCICLVVSGGQFVEFYGDYTAHVSNACILLIPMFLTAVCAIRLQKLKAQDKGL